MKYLDYTGLQYFWSKLKALFATKQDSLVPGENIKTINGNSILGSGDIQAGDPDAVKYVSQTLTETQKAQARTNISAVAASAISALETAIAAKYSKPSGGIPETDLASAVQSALALARTSIQSLADYYSKTEVDALLAAVGSEQYVDVTTLPTASASTLGKIYLVGPDTNGFYDRYYTSYDGSTYSWVAAGNTEINLANYATKDEVSQLRQEVGDIYSDLVIPFPFSPIVWNDNNLLRTNGGITVVTDGTYFNRCATSDGIPCSALRGKNIKFTHGNYGTFAVAFYYNPDNMVSGGYHSYSGSGTEVLVVPSNADFFRVGVTPSTSADLANAKAGVSVESAQTVNPVQKSFIKGIFTKFDYIREIYIPDSTKTIAKVQVRKAVAYSGNYRSRVDVTFTDATSAYFDLVNVPEADALDVFKDVVTDEDNKFYILFSNQVPTGDNAVYANELFDTNATHILDLSPSIKEYIHNLSVTEDITSLEAEVADNTEKVQMMASALLQTQNFQLVWNDNKLLRYNGGITDITSGTYLNRCSTTDIVLCADFVGKELTVNYGERNNDATYLAFYNASDNLIGEEYTTLSGTGTANITIPAGAAWFRLGVVPPTSSNLATQKAATSASTQVVKDVSETPKMLFSAQRMGAMKYALPTDFDFAQILFFGQSFAQGGSSKTGTTGVIPNCLMFGDNVKATTGAAFNPLEQDTYEYPVVSCANALSQMYRRYGHNVNIVASTAGTGGVSIVTLLNSYVPNVEEMQTNMKSVADGESKSVGCFAIVYMQGETDYREGEVNGKDAYKAYLLQVKNALQQSAMDNLGQTRKPIFFLYQTSGSAWINNYGEADNEQLGPSMAQIEFAAENEDVILISPAYQVTTYQDGHPATNGERWLGEYYAKAIWQTLYRGFRYKNPIPMEFKVEGKKISIFVSDCVLPLQKNTWTLAQQTAYGFAVKADGVSVVVESVELIDNAIVLNLGTDVSSASSVKITYGGVGVGKGNICDSDTWATWLQYLSDTGDTGYDGIRVITQAPTAKGGGSLVGMDYPMNNFLCLFYKEITR